jgi:hypothetical protein
VAMVTASHNDNGWTGVKMGANRPLTFGPDEMTRLKEIVLNADFSNKVGGSYEFHENFPARYIADLTSPSEAEAQAESRGRLRQRYRGRLRTAGNGSDRLRGGAARHRARLHLSEVQSQSRRYGNAARDPRRRAGTQGRCWPRIRRRRRPLRRGRQYRRGDFRRQGRRHAGARHVGDHTKMRNLLSM